MEEIKLIEQAQLGDKKSLEDLIKKYESTVITFLLKSAGIRTVPKILCRKLSLV